MGGPVEISGDQLRSIVERIEHIEEEIKELNEGKREIFQEAKSNGFDVRVIREIVRLRKQDQKEREEHESLLEVYLRAIKGARASKAAYILPPKLLDAIAGARPRARRDRGGAGGRGAAAAWPPWLTPSGYRFDSKLDSERPDHISFGGRLGNGSCVVL